MKKRLILISLIVLFLFILIYQYNKNTIINNSDNNLHNQIIKTSNNILYKQLYANNKKLCIIKNDVISNIVHPDKDESVLLINMTDNICLCAYNVFIKRYPASLTKLMTSYIVLNSNIDLNSIVKCNDDIAYIDKSSSVANLKVGDKLTVKSLLYGTLLPSGNDASIALAYSTCKTINDFNNKMNKYANHLAMTGTNFINVNGLHNKKHYTTAYDMYLIFNECLNNKLLIDILSTPIYNTKINRDNYMINLKWINTNKYLNGSIKIPYNIVSLAGKTGTTDEAGSCLIQYIKSNSNKKYIAIIMGAKNKYILYNHMNKLLSVCK